jgi:hypothetical protein
VPNGVVPAVPKAARGGLVGRHRKIDLHEVDQRAHRLRELIGAPPGGARGWWREDFCSSPFQRTGLYFDLLMVIVVLPKTWSPSFGAVTPGVTSAVVAAGAM